MKWQRGQTLIEALGAIAILGIVVSATAVAVTTSLSNATYNKDKTLATKYAQEGSEIVHQLRDDSYSQFSRYNGNYCLASGQTTLGSPQPSCSLNINGEFIRSVQIQQGGVCGGGNASVTVKVAFTSGKCAAGTYCHSQIATSCLSTVNPVQAP